MAEKKTGDPKDGAEHVGGRRFVPVSGLYGTAAIMPGPLTPGKPRPEPADEHWTLGPGRRAEAPASDDDAPGAEEIPSERARGTVRPAEATDTEPDPA